MVLIEFLKKPTVNLAKVINKQCFAFYFLLINVFSTINQPFENIFQFFNNYKFI
jgi:hypothetical protein